MRNIIATQSAQSCCFFDGRLRASQPWVLSGEDIRATLLGMESPFFTIDRVTDGVAVLIGDDGTAYEIDAGQLPADAGEGAVLRSAGDGFGDGFTVDDAERDRRTRRIRGKLDALRGLGQFPN